MIDPDPNEFLFLTATGRVGFDGIAYKEARIDAWVAWATHSAVMEAKAIIASIKGHDPLGKCLINFAVLHEDTRYELSAVWRASAAND